MPGAPKMGSHLDSILKENGRHKELLGVLCRASGVKSGLRWTDGMCLCVFFFIIVVFFEWVCGCCFFWLVWVNLTFERLCLLVLLRSIMEGFLVLQVATYLFEFLWSYHLTCLLL